MEPQTRRLIKWLLGLWVGLGILALTAKEFGELSLADWVVAFCPFVTAGMGAYMSLKPIPESQHRKWFWTFIILGAASTLSSLYIAGESKRSGREDRQVLVTQLGQLRIVTPLRKQLFELAAEMNEYADQMARDAAGIYQDRLRGKKSYDEVIAVNMSESEVRKVFDTYVVGAKDYHSRFDRRLADLLSQVSAATGKLTDQILKKSLALEASNIDIKGVAADITNLAGTLP